MTKSEFALAVWKGFWDFLTSPLGIFVVLVLALTYGVVEHDVVRGAIDLVKDLIGAGIAA